MIEIIVGDIVTLGGKKFKVEASDGYGNILVGGNWVNQKDVEYFYGEENEI